MEVSYHGTRGALVGSVLTMLVAAGTMGATAPIAAQVDSTAVVAVGQKAPGFSAPGATRYGLLAQPVSLADFSGKTVVLAFFYKARTKG